MSTPEFRVRPVVRHVVTRYVPPNANVASGVETLGEFDSEGYAEIVREALAERVAPREFVLVEQSPGEMRPIVFYAYGEDEVERVKAQHPETGFRVFNRIRQPDGQPLGEPAWE
jgi:hypothetical protein